MNNIRIKAFILHKEGDLSMCEDSYAISLSSGRFAIADGLSNSNHPEFTAQLLCRKFVDGALDINDWDNAFPVVLLNDVHPYWIKAVDEYESTLSGRKLGHAQVRRETLPAGASPFLGIDVDPVKGSVRGRYLGDSTLFTISEGTWNVICSNNLDGQSESEVLYDNHPSCVTADGVLYGKWNEIDIPLEKGFMILATDGAAEWIQSELQNGNPVADQLWALDDHDTFVDLVAAAREHQKMEDDITLIILKIDELPAGGYEPVWTDVFPAITYFADQFPDPDSPSEEIATAEEPDFTDINDKIENDDPLECQNPQSAEDVGVSQEYKPEFVKISPLRNFLFPRVPFFDKLFGKINK